MLHAGGIEVVVAGFHRDPEGPREIGGAEVIDLGRTHDARLIQRAGQVAGRIAGASHWSRAIGPADVYLARTLEMLTLAEAVRGRSTPSPALAYESLDIHRLLLGRSLGGRLLRALERRLIARSDLVIVSSPAFVRDYFEPRQSLGERLMTPVLVVENKVFGDSAPLPGPASAPPPGPPWRIGWFGMIRCRRSLDLLCDIAGRRPDLLQVEIRGRPSYDVFEDFEAQVARCPGAAFGGRYRPEDLCALYQGVHFNWAIDWFEAGGNSDMLLPNRLYEGGLAGAPALALEGVETGRWLERHGLGVRFADPARSLEPFLETLDPKAYAALRTKAANAPKSLFVAGAEDTGRLARALAGLMEEDSVSHDLTHAEEPRERPTVHGRAQQAAVSGNR
jgi:succinoglycan biosynthesis protein ExoL